MCDPIPALWSYAQKLRWSLRCRGLGMTTLTCLGNVLRFARCQWYFKLKEVAFDRRHRIDTRGMIWIDSLDVADRDKQRGWGYMATQPEWFGILLSQLDVDVSQFSFVDFGSGKGRSLLLAAEFPFRQIIGVEFSRQLHEAAEANIQDWRSSTQQCRRIRAVHADATRFALPPSPLILYMYNPFKEDVMREVLANVRADLQSDPRPLLLIYANPTCRTLCDQQDWLHLAADAAEHDPPIVVYAAAETLDPPHEPVAQGPDHRSLGDHCREPIVASGGV